MNEMLALPLHCNPEKFSTVPPCLFVEELRLLLADSKVQKQLLHAQHAQAELVIHWALTVASGQKLAAGFLEDATGSIKRHV